MSDFAIRVQNISKQYRIGLTLPRGQRSLRSQLPGLVASPLRRFRYIRGLSHFSGSDRSSAKDVIWALRDISLDVKPGEAVGIIGHNGAGKSTLLKVLSRITEPTEGYATLSGRPGSLLEVGTGFHKELTGRENIYVNGAILGMTRKEVGRKLDEIVEFAGMEDFIDTPVKRYSTGMSVRLAFAVVAHLEADILLIDEVLAVGDADFQQRCLKKMFEVINEGRTVIFVSHNMGLLTRLCQRTLWIEHGRIKMDGLSSEVVGAYLSPEESRGPIWIHPLGHCHEPQARLMSARVLSTDGEVTEVIPYNEQFKLQIEYEAVESVPNIAIFSRVIDSQNNIVWTSLDADAIGWDGQVRRPGRYVSTCCIPGAILKPGRYRLTVGSLVRGATLRSLRSHTNEYQSRDHENVLAFDISAAGCDLDLDRPGIVTPYLKWETCQIDGKNGS